MSEAASSETSVNVLACLGERRRPIVLTSPTLASLEACIKSKFQDVLPQSRYSLILQSKDETWDTFVDIEKGQTILNKTVVKVIVEQPNTLEYDERSQPVLQPKIPEDLTKETKTTTLGCSTAQRQRNQEQQLQSQATFDYLSHSKPMWDLKGLQVATGRSIEITFHAIVPKLLWEWDDTSCMYIRFGHKDLGEWQHNVGRFNQSRSNDDGTCEMTCTLKVQVELTKLLPYKYVIFSSKMKGKDDCFEFLHSFARHWDPDPTRCLNIKEIQAVEGYHQYDTKVYPKDVKAVKTLFNTLRTGAKALKESFLPPKSSSQRGDDRDVEFKPLSENELAAQCLHFYLEPYKTMLAGNGEYPEEFNADVVVFEIVHIFNVINLPWVNYRSRNMKLMTTMKEWLESIIKALCDVRNEEKQFISATCIACCLKQCSIDYQKRVDFLFPLLEMLQVKPDLERKRCPKYNSLCNLIARENFRYETYIAAAVEELCYQVAKADVTKEANKDWLSVLPLYHFMKHASKPFQLPQCNSHKIKFHTELLDHVKGISLPQGCADDLYDNLKTLFAADPMLLHVFIAMCPEEDYLNLFLKVPPYLSLCWVSRLKKSVETNAGVWLTWLEHINIQLNEESQNECIVASMKAAQLLFAHLTAKLTKYITNSFGVLMLSLNIVLLSLSKYVLIAPDADKDNVKKVLQSTSQTLKAWIIKKDVIGGSMFGGSIEDGDPLRELEEVKFKEAIGFYEAIVTKHFNHLMGISAISLANLCVFHIMTSNTEELWKSVLTLEIISEEIAEQWRHTTKQLIEERVKEVPARNKLELVLLLEEKDNVHPILSDVITGGCRQSLDQLASNSNEHTLEGIFNMDSEIVGSQFGHLLKKKYPELKPSSPNFSLDDLLNWPHWPTLIKIYRMNSRMKKGLPQECILACNCAISKLCVVFQMLWDRKVTILDLMKIKGQESQMKLLCEAQLPKKNEANNSEEKVMDKKAEAATCEEMISAVTHRIGELNFFKLWKKFYQQVCRRLQILPQIKGVSEAMDQLGENYNCCMISSLCTRTGSIITLECFHSAMSLQRFATKFWNMTKEKKTKIFDSTWSKSLEDARASNPSMTIDHVEKKVWVPAFTQCQQLLQDVYHRSLTLISVDTYFLQYERELNKIENDLQSLFCGVRACDADVCKGIPRNSSWIHQAVTQMDIYWRLCACHDAANTFLQLRTSFKLTKGDFSNVKKISGEMSSSMKDEKLTLADIDEQLLTAGQFLSEFTGPKLECIRKFSECQDMIQWIRETTTDVSDLLTFVNLALATAAGGEDALAHDRLSNLRTVGSGFGSLIYNLEGNTGFEELSQRCMSLWAVLQDNPDLPLLLESCNKELEWYKSVKETHGSVEETSFGQMKNILCYGCYTVGEEQEKTMHSIRDIIHLKLQLEEKDKQLPKTNYNLDELKDLESKLVLITGSKAENRKEVEQFVDTLHSVCRIAEVLISLQQVGNVKYIGWKMEFYCQQNVVEGLQASAKIMEEELEKWKKEVKEARNKFYELNYYTTCQLLVLRSELGKLRAPVPAPFCRAQVMALLKSISHDVTPDYVESVVANEITGRDRPHEETTDDTLESFSSEPRHQLQTPARKSGDISTDVQASQSDTRTRTSLVKFSLDAKELETFTNITETLGYSEEFVLRAIHECSTGDQYEIMSWIQKHKEEQMVMLQSMRFRTNREIECDEEEEEEEVEEEEGREEEKKEKDKKKASITSERSQKDKIMEKTVPQACLNSEADVALKQPVHEHMQAIIVAVNPDTEKKYLKLEELGLVLKKLNCKLPATVQSKRSFSQKILKTGHPNLILVSPEKVLRAALSLYMEDGHLPMPTPEELLICNENTTSEEVNLLWQRAVCDEPHFRRVFCLVHAEKLPYQTAERTLKFLNEIIQARTGGYRLVVICSNHNEEKSHIISKLHLYHRPFVVSSDIVKYQQYLLQHFVSGKDPDHQTRADCLPMVASQVDHEGSCVRVVSSNRAGVGKSLFIMRMAEQLQKHLGKDRVIITIPIHGPRVTTETVIECLESHQDDLYCTILHFDIAPSVLWQMDTILFSLLIQRGLCDSQGRVWRNHPSQLYAIEVTLPEQHDSTLRQNLPIPESCTMAVLEMLPLVNRVKPKDALLCMTKGTSTDEDIMLMDLQEYESPVYQRVYQYLKHHNMDHNLDQFFYAGITEGTMVNCLQIILNYCGVKDPSWAELRHFVWFLNWQLESCEKSVFCNQDIAGRVLAGFKGFAVKFMIRMSRDFATSSLRGEVDQENELLLGQEDNLAQYQIVERRQWEQSTHPYIVFNKDRTSFTFVGFVVSTSYELMDPTRKCVLEGNIMTKELYAGLRRNGVVFDEDFSKWTKNDMITKLSTVMGVEPYDPDETYVLTVDNLIKILAIQMRFRCGIPVVIMGETGCGKTRLIRFMCDLAANGTGKRNMLIMKVHGGITDKDIETFLENAMEQAKDNSKSNLDTIVFFDEANTTESIGLIKELMCDRRLRGKPIPQDLKFIAACNPYRRHSNEMIKKLHSAGLGFHVSEAKTKQKLGKIPLRELVYRVIDLPPSMRPLVYDFGQLNIDMERDYIHQIVFDHLKEQSVHSQQHPKMGSRMAKVFAWSQIKRHKKMNNQDELSQQHSEHISAVAKVLAWSQKYMRDRKDECSFVSLRDVERAMIVFKYFLEKMPLFGPLMDKRKEQEKASKWFSRAGVNSEIKALTRSLVLALSVCYHARLKDREEYVKGVVEQFTAPLAFSGGTEQFKNEIRWCQEVLLDSMELGKNIARNAALRENVFMIAVCVDLRIPLFLVGKPGSSKSLAKAIVASSMQGQASSNDLLKSFRQVHMFSYQCSQLSTAESVIKVFSTAKRFQQNQDTTKYVPVVVLEEVGLAEDTPHLPLKALHPLLEDGTEGADDGQEVLDREKRVAFIGISNWALDPAKMNRGVMVTRGDPDTNELVLSARGICSNEDNDPVKQYLEPWFQHLADAYAYICSKQKRQFFGLRDFYSLIKMLYWICEKTKMSPTAPQFLHAIKRNFGGLEDEDLHPVHEFSKRLGISITSDHQSDLSDDEHELFPFTYVDNSSLGLIKASLITKEKTWHGENRYLLFLTENYAALDMLKLYLQGHEGKHMDESTLKPWEMEPFTLFGSSFPKDKEYMQVCRNINRIKICIETGRTVILLNLENLYESLYDVLNQHYTHHGGSRYVDLGLQTQRVKCRVHEEFKLILIAEKTDVYNRFPTPLINRMEKHFVLTSSALEKWQSEVLNLLQKWVENFSHVSNSDSRFEEKDAFVGYQTDTAAVVVFQASNQLHQYVQEREHGAHSSYMWVEALEKGLLQVAPMDDLKDTDKSSKKWKQSVLAVSQFFLLQTTNPAALIRLHRSTVSDQFASLSKLYSLQHHSSIHDFLSYYMKQDSFKGGLLLQVSTHSHLLSYDEVQELGRVLSVDEECVVSFLLHEFDTELDFTNKISPHFVLDSGMKQTSIIIIQCDFGYADGNLIACARYRIYDMRAKALQQQAKALQQRVKATQQISRVSSHTPHVLFIIHLPVQSVQSSFVGFQGDPWVSCHIDELRRSSNESIALEVDQGVSISELFYGGPQSPSPGEERDMSQFAEEPESTVFHHLAKKEEDEGVEMQDEEEGMEVVELEEEEEEEKIVWSETGEQDQRDVEGQGENTIEEGKEKEDDMEIEHPNRSARNQEGRAEVIHQMYTQCTRLNSCIQAAASRLQDSTQNNERAIMRVKLLIKLIPQVPSFPLKSNSFYGVLVGHIFRLLRERESVHQTSDWVLDEAMSINSLQHGGTFKNVLARKFDNVIVPIFAEIIAFLDHNYNLGLLQTGSETTSLSQFWLRMFRSPRTKQQLCYAQMVSRENVPMAEKEFKAQFPFSWLVKETMDSQWEGARSTAESMDTQWGRTTYNAGNYRRRLHQQLIKLVQDTAVGEILLSVTKKNSEEMYQRYLHDFARIAHTCTHRRPQIVKSEYKLITDTIHNMIVCGSEFHSKDGHRTVINWIAAVHVVYSSVSEELHWFSQLTSQYPGIISSLTQMTPGEESMMLHLYALDKILDHLKPPIEVDRKLSFDCLRQWLSQLQLSRNTIDSTLSLPSQHPLAMKARHKWQLIRAIQMFTEHVLMKHRSSGCSMISYARQLQDNLGEEPDFLMCVTVNEVKKFLSKMSEEQKTIKKSCYSFFIEMVSSLCFGQSSSPEDTLLEMLLKIVFTEREEEGGTTGLGTRELTPYQDDLKTDENPVIQSFLLHLLIQHNKEKVKDHLNTYFETSQQTSEAVDLDLCLLCSQCFEDALDKELSSQPLPQRLTESVDLLKAGMKTHMRKAGFTQRNITIDLLEDVAKVRYALLVVADLLQQQVDEVGGASSENHIHIIHGDTANCLLETARQVCTAEAINTIDTTGKNNTTGPIVYLLKMIVRQYGFGCLKKIVEKYQWVVPLELMRNVDVTPFVMYNPVYSSLREVIKAAAYGNTFDVLAQTTLVRRAGSVGGMKNLQFEQFVPLLLGIYEVVTLSHTNTLPSQRLLPEVLRKLNSKISKCKVLSKQLKWMARALIANEQGGTLAALRASPDQPTIQRTMAALVVHTAATLFSKKRVKLLHPLVSMLTKPADLTGTYLPTMPEDLLPEARKIITKKEGGQFYECPRGHPYFIGECGRPWVVATCNICGSAIGGSGHKPVAYNRTARTKDTTQVGHCLGRPNGRDVIPSSERSLSPAACNILRAIMHSALIWASCKTDSDTGGLLALVKGEVRPNELPEFFWGHLERDLRLVGRALGKNVDEAAIVVHMVIKHISTTELTTSSSSVLKNRKVREKWEKLFNHNCIQPVLERVEENLQNALKVILMDDKQDHGPLFYLVYEHVQMVPGSLEPHLWGYRPRISLFHLGQVLQQQKKEYPILKEFLKEEPILRATQYLPDIVRLQHSLYDTFHHRLDRKDAQEKTISQFIKERGSENVQDKYRQMVDSVQRAWSLVGDKLKDHARLRVDDQYLIPAITMDTTLDYLIPTTTGPGACTFALVDYLVRVHNDFMEHCRNRFIEGNGCEWQEHKVPLTHIHRCHLLDYEHKLPSIILSHCHYSLRAGQGQDVTYDLPLLEKHILDQFILGRPTILVDIPQVVYCKDIYTAATFAAIREKVSKQVSLPSPVQHDILQELRSPDLLRCSLDVVDIVLGFLTSGGGKPKTKLAVYLKKLKMADKTFSNKAKEYCNLEHVLSLWQTLSVGLATMITLSDQEPFDTIPADLRKDLTNEQQESLDQCLQRFDLDFLLVILQEFIETYVRHIDMNSNEKTWGLVVTLIAHLERNNLKGTTQLEELPNDITLAETVATWKYIVHFQKRQKQE